MANSLESVGRAWHKAKIKDWSDGHAKRIIKELEKRVFPFIGALPIEQVQAPDILNLVLRPMEAESLGDNTYRIKQRLGLIFAFVITEGRITHNPVTGLEKALKKAPKIQHRKYLTPNQCGRFMCGLESYEGDIQTRLAIR